MNKIKIRNIILSCTLVLVGFGLLVGCDIINEIISDTLEAEIESKVNEMLGDAAEQPFELPEATRYEGFSVDETGDTTTYKIDVIEPKVTFDDYVASLAASLGTSFDEVDLGELQGQEEWEYVDGDTTYKVHFKEGADKWEIEVSVTTPQPSQLVE